MSIHRYEFVPDVSTFFVPLYRQIYINCRHTGSYLYIDKLLFRHTGSYLYRQTTISTPVDISVRRHTGSYLYIDKPLYRQLSIYRYVDIAVRRHSGWTPNNHVRTENICIDIQIKCRYIALMNRKRIHNTVITALTKT